VLIAQLIISLCH